NYGKAGDGSDWGLKEEFVDELSDADLDKALNLLYHKDGRSNDAGRIQTALIEIGQWLEGRSKPTCEKDIRDTLATMNATEIGRLKVDYKQLAERKNEGKTTEQLDKEGKPYCEPDLETALLKNKNLSDKTKQAIEIFLKGTDERTKEDTLT